MPRYYKLLPYEVHQKVRIRSRGYLPHWEVDAACYFITYRLADSLPRAVVEDLLQERRRLQGPMPAVTAVQRADLARRFGLRLDFYLRQNYGACHLKRPEIAQCVVENLRHFHGTRYRLIAWCVMPNHVHVVIDMDRGADLDRVLHSWKSYTGLRANQLLGLSGQFWHPEYFDRVIRDDEDLKTTVEYVLGNPAKAGLRDWKWVGMMG
jgi:REP element-mobilizing transposase RayT